MRTSFRLLLTLLLLLLAVVPRRVVAAPPPAAPPPAVPAQTDPRLVAIVSPQGTTGELSAAEFRRLVTGEKQRWNGGAKVSVALMKTTNPVGEATAQRVYRMTGNELNKYWLALVFQGRAKAPQFFASEADLAAYVRDTPGAIGILSQAAATGQRTAAVDGKDAL